MKFGDHAVKHIRLIPIAVLSLTFAAAPAWDPAWAIELNPLIVIKGAVEVGVEDRSAEDFAADLKIKAKITVEVIDKMGSDVISMNFDVYEKDVMLTGKVERPEQKTQAGKLTATIEGVKKIYNEILVIKPVDENKGTVENFIDDSIIETKINALLLDGKGVNVTNFRWRAVNGRVFLFGRALSAEEHNKAVNIVKGIKGVISVTSRVKIRPKD